MKIKFVGAVGKVTGSCVWCVHEHKQSTMEFLVDCGMVQGDGQDAENCKPFPFDPERLKFVLLTHAHMDHCGRIPQLFHQGFRGKVICTSATAQLARLQLRDAHRQAQRRGKAAGDGGAASDPRAIIPIPPDKKWFRHIEERRGHFEFGKPVWIEHGLYVSFRPSSHMLGCCSITVMWPSKNGRRLSVCFSGDIGPAGGEGFPATMLGENQPPSPSCPYLVVESTYGGKPPREPKHQSFNDRLLALARAVSARRTVVIPCFSMQRAQEVLFDIWNMRALVTPAEKFSGLEVVLDSPLAKAANKIFRQEMKKRSSYLNLLWRIAPKSEKAGRIIEALGGSQPCWIRHAKIRSGKSADGDNVFNPADGKKRVVVTSSGMCHAGPVLSYLPLLRDKNAAFVITGFQNTRNGRELQKIAKRQKSGKWSRERKVVRLSVSDNEGELEEFRVNARVFDLAPYYSGHADINTLVNYILEFTEMSFSSREYQDAEIGLFLKPPAATVFLNHGNNQSREKMREKILTAASDEGLSFIRRKISKVVIPSATDPFFNLDRGS